VFLQWCEEVEVARHKVGCMADGQSISIEILPEFALLYGDGHYHGQG